MNCEICGKETGSQISTICYDESCEQKFWQQVNQLRIEIKTATGTCVVCGKAIKGEQAYHGFHNKCEPYI